MQIEKRSMAGSDVWLTRIAQAVWSVWRIDKGVREGYQANSWVFRAISLIADAASSVPWVVFGPKNEMLWDHPVSQLLRNPNPQWTRQQLMRLIVCWLELSGNAYLKKVSGANGLTAELWPASPDRLAPKPSADPAKFIDGYEEIDAKGVKRLSVDFTPENTIHLKYIDPANPYQGVSTLGAAARAVDLDNAQQDWNKSGMDNRGVFDGMFSFKQQVDTTMAKSLSDRIKEKFLGVRNARKPLVLGSDAQYQRMSLSPAEVDFLNSRKFNRDEIFIVFGVPPQLGGSQEASTYNNFAASMRIFWETKVIPGVLDNIRDCLQRSFADELSEGLTIGPDLSNVRALQTSEDEKAKTAETFSKMGVPFSQINERLELGFQPWEGWDKPRAAVAQPAGDAAANDTAGRRWALLPMERRSLEDEIAARDSYAEGPMQAACAALLDQQRQDVFAAMESGANVRDAVMQRKDEWRGLIATAYTDVSLKAASLLLDASRGKSPHLERREGYSPEMKQAIEEALAAEGVILRELSLIMDATAKMIIDQVTYGVENEMTIAQIQQAILDTGAFSPERALRIARTVSGTAMSVGQMTAGEMAGAEKKQWMTAGAETRHAHSVRDGETVAIKARFSAQIGAVGPRYPGDPDVAAADRINCFLPGTKIRGNVLGASRARYKGQAVEIVTRGGRVIRVTDNHPVLAEHGFVFAREIKVGDKLVSCVVDDHWASSPMVADEHDKPALIEQVFGAFAEFGFVELPGRRADDFYGDGEFVDGDVEVVWANGALLNARKAALTKRGCDVVLEAEDLPLDRLVGDGARAPGLDAVTAPAGGFPGGSELPLDGAIDGSKRLPLQGFSFGLGSRLNAVFDQLSIDRSASDADHLGNGVHGHACIEAVSNASADFRGYAAPALREPEFAPLLASYRRDPVELEVTMDGRDRETEAVRDFLHGNEELVQLDDVVGVRRFSHDGPVYDVMTRNGIVAGNNIITSNCRCSMSFE